MAWVKFISAFIFSCCYTHSNGLFRDGGWTYWTVFRGGCVTQCGWGWRPIYMHRTCTNPVPRGGGMVCPGPDRNYTEEICRVPNNCEVLFATWAQWFYRHGPCSATCGRGTKIRYEERRCNRGSRTEYCRGISTRSSIRLCDLPACAVDGGWSPWKFRYSRCYGRCGWGNRTVRARRKCNKPVPQNGGKRCPGPKRNETVEWCEKKQKCTVHRWSGWFTTWGPCSTTCGPGDNIKYETRKCNSPNGSESSSCPGPSSRSSADYCMIDLCDPYWGSWVETVGPCSQTCGNSGTLIVYEDRRCFRGDVNFRCRGPSRRTKGDYCSDNPECPINGYWGAWTTSYGQCTARCGWGYRKVYVRRDCDRPAPAHGGMNCPGVARNDSESWCKDRECPDTGWSGWFSTWGPCSVSCGRGERIMVERRRCNTPDGSNSNSCPGISMRSSTFICTEPACGRATVQSAAESTSIIIYIVIGFLIFTALGLAALMIVWKKRTSYKGDGVDNPSYL